MKKLRTALLVTVYTATVCAGTWLLRGEYDRLFMLDGYFHVVNQTDRDRGVVLEFPSGASVRLQLAKHGSVDLEVPDTGEGSIAVSVDGQPRDRVGYVTSVNGTVVLVIGEKRTSFSQILQPGV